jgi:hypothetical protein
MKASSFIFWVSIQSHLCESEEIVIPAKAGIQKPDWIPPYQVRGGLIKPGMTDHKRRL